MSNIKLILFIFFIPTISCNPISQKDIDHFNKALENSISANEGYIRCMNYVKSWMEYADPSTGLIPENLERGIDTWSPHNSAADNYPFMVLTSYLLDRDLFEGKMMKILENEKNLSSRLGPLPASYSFSRQGYLYTEPDTARIIFGASEYIKDGLIPLTEYLGPSPWSERMMEILDELLKFRTMEPDLNTAGLGPSVEKEINGELLQILSRVYWMTGDKKYLNRAIEIADHYLLEHPEKLLKSERLRLRDHGCEIIAGLSELYATLHFTDPGKKIEYRDLMKELFDRILEVARNEDGMFYNEVNMVTGKAVNAGIVDNWGYTYNAYYTLYMVDRIEEYREAVLYAFQNLNTKYRNFDWESGSSDGFADAIEGGINFYNREQDPELKTWIDNEIQIMWSLQDSSYRENAQRWKGSGIIEGWHGDGNFARTTIMYCLWKTQDVTLQPWREDVLLGSVQKDSTLYIAVSAEKDWEGKLYFGKERHQEIFHLPIDYPRINQFPEWFSIENNITYMVKQDRKTSKVAGSELEKGIYLRVKAGKPFFILIEKPKHSIPGTGFSGKVVSVGNKVTSFKKGDQVFGESTLGFSTNPK